MRRSRQLTAIAATPYTLAYLRCCWFVNWFKVPHMLSMSLLPGALGRAVVVAAAGGWLQLPEGCIWSAGAEDWPQLPDDGLCCGCPHGLTDC